LNKARIAFDEEKTALTTLFLEASVYLIQLLVDQILFAAEVSRTPKLHASVPGGVQDAPSDD